MDSDSCMSDILYPFVHQASAEEWQYGYFQKDKCYSTYSSLPDHVILVIVIIMSEKTWIKKIGKFVPA
jgi:hypothetical protein